MAAIARRGPPAPTRGAEKAHRASRYRRRGQKRGTDRPGRKELHPGKGERKKYLVYCATPHRTLWTLPSGGGRFFIIIIRFPIHKVRDFSPIRNFSAIKEGPACSSAHRRDAGPVRRTDHY